MIGHIIQGTIFGFFGAFAYTYLLSKNVKKRSAFFLVVIAAALLGAILGLVSTMFGNHHD